MDYIKAIAKHFEVKPEQVMSYRVYGDEVATVIDRGIQGCPKYIIPLSALTDKPQMAEPVEEKLETKPEPLPVRRYTGKRGAK